VTARTRMTLRWPGSTGWEKSIDAVDVGSETNGSGGGGRSPRRGREANAPRARACVEQAVDGIEGRRTFHPMTPPGSRGRVVEDAHLDAHAELGAGRDVPMLGGRVAVAGSTKRERMISAAALLSGHHDRADRCAGAERVRSSRGRRVAWLWLCTTMR